MGSGAARAGAEGGVDRCVLATSESSVRMAAPWTHVAEDEAGIVVLVGQVGRLAHDAQAADNHDDYDDEPHPRERNSLDHQRSGYSLAH